MGHGLTYRLGVVCEAIACRQVVVFEIPKKEGQAKNYYFSGECFLFMIYFQNKLKIVERFHPHHDLAPPLQNGDHCSLERWMGRSQNPSGTRVPPTQQMIIRQRVLFDIP